MGILMRNGINYSGSQLPSVTTEDSGKILTVNNNGAWAAQEVPTDEQVSEAVDEWLTNHPEATTTVQDNSLTWVKFNDVLKNMMFKLGITDSKSGEVVSTSDAAEFPLKDLQSEITATQNLNGYEYPWVGGAGKNLCPKFSQVSQSGITVTVADDGTLTINGTATATVNMTILGLNIPAGTYTLSLNNPTTVGTSASNSIYAFARNINNAWVMNPIAKTANAVGTGTTEYPINSVVIVINSGVSVSNYIMKPQLELGSTATAYAPYSNICPISGRTKVNVTRMGKNLLPFDNVLSNGWTNTLNGITATYSNGVMRVVGTSTSDEPTDIVKFYFIWSSNPITFGAGKYVMADHLTISASIDGAIYAQKTTAFTAETSVAIRGFWISVPARQTVDWTIPMFFAEGDTFNTELGRTVYGGTLDLTTGELKITHAIVDLGDLTWTLLNTNLFRTTLYTKKDGYTNFTTTCYRTVNKTFTELQNGETASITLSEHGHPLRLIHVKDERVTTGEDFKTLVTGQKMVYELATPQTISLTPTEVMMLENNNTIWSDSGDVAVSYLVDAKTYIDNQ